MNQDVAVLWALRRSYYETAGTAIQGIRNGLKADGLPSLHRLAFAVRRPDTTLHSHELDLLGKYLE